ncbi:NAD(P)H-dependent glycerol-3-phosphate dehydrogenase [Janibacter terrae]|jgi:glycerol-3-phosphate dehydrogenase (NAD(P)+)|uniref:NAD(P)H-dependent glycerol-3-phosphate dehydrogenase n=1 Tax=Janibacter terrae TaxID=103817 RepID=UPI0008391247|nr:NAD(P)H-dependent glycerol-3-phosphate dehydrogenase [Janibacter terrae]MBA4083697.1 NAD(P)-dependent glycerol-3-phosphate dehydrogenase [Kytococcus sp.]HBO54040.1 NAD(P)-dependent glycerol-3-phosphate dehydrogenase [Janibacter terrae]HCE60476.1 NAD(P)-dependent glycerol-3-phosphate dehydrogenase [Janibacter terrae]
MSHIAVFGAGSWGTAFATILAAGGNDVRVWGRRAELVAQINAGSNDDYLPGVRLSPRISASTDPAEVADGAEIVILSVPSQSLRANLSDWGSLLAGDRIVVSLMKGIELGTTRRMSEVIHEVAGVPVERIGVVSGPNLAKEIVQQQPAASVVACPDLEAANRVAAACSTSFFRPYTSTDVIGAELGGAVKNVIALAVGMAAGLGFGDNTKATIITRGLAETTRLAMALGADPRTMSGLAGVGDLIATCMSPLSRNHSFGVKLGEGLSVADVTEQTKQTAEGVKSCASILDLARAHGVDVPITEQVTRVVHEGVSPQDMVGVLLGRARKHETD